MSEVDIQRIAEEAAEKAVAKFDASHHCRFTDDEAHIGHLFFSHIDQDGIYVLAKAATALSSVVTTVARWIVIALLFVAILIIALFFHRHLPDFPK